jgi:hypothetical protein
MIAYKLRGVRNSAVASQPCPSGHITADKRLRYASPKFAIGELPLFAETSYDLLLGQ